MTLSISDIQHNNALPYVECRNAECRYAECSYAECRGAVNVPLKLSNDVTRN
jgi:hypothetical protein